MKTLLLAILLSTSAMADQDSYDAGYEEGYRSLQGDMVLMPLTPLAPLTPLGSTDFREGIRQGYEDAEDSGYDYRYGDER